MLKVGQTLQTLDGTKIGNAIIFGVFTHEILGGNIYWVHTDFGNDVWFSEQEIHDWFGLGPVTDTKRWMDDRRILQQRTTVMPLGLTQVQ